MVDFEIGPAAPHVPDGLADLAREAAVEGVRNVGTVVSRWGDGTERFDRPGECLLVAVAGDGAVIGIGGLTVCPTVPGAMRVRRFNVAPAWRRKGVARALAATVIERGLELVPLLTCNAGASPQAPVFWERMGFERTSRPGITHVLARR